jgi:four helix bundle protein
VLAAQRPVSYRVLDQLVSASTSVGANLEEAKAASSDREFVRMCEIALRGAREAAYWIRICRHVGLLPASAEQLQREAEELGTILATIVIKTKRKIGVRRAIAGAGCLALLPLLAHAFSLAF